MSEQLPTDREPLRCRLGFHTWTTIPDDVRARMLKSRVLRVDWYAGRQVAPYCTGCGRPGGTSARVRRLGQ